MAIARKPNSKPKSPMDEAAADAFIAGAAKPKAEPIATEADEAGPGAEPRKSPVMLRFDRALLAKVDAAAKRRGIRRSAWTQFPGLGRASCRGRVCSYVYITVVAGSLQKNTKKTQLQ